MSMLESFAVSKSWERSLHTVPVLRLFGEPGSGGPASWFSGGFLGETLVLLHVLLVLFLGVVLPPLMPLLGTS